VTPRTRERVRSATIASIGVTRTGVRRLRRVVDGDGLVVGVDPRSDAAVYAEHAPALVRFATGLVGPADAADVVSDAVLALMVSPIWREARDRRALLYRAVLFASRSRQRGDARRRDRERRASSPGAVAPPDAQPEVWAAVAALSAQQRAVVFLAYWEDLDPARIATLLGVSEGSVRKQLARARARLREVLG
jgi:RNA polymerase sigma factor (sigma-70 family)